ncbi:hypothetical protein H0H92_001137 [Tricholoma furcatifolium]|nr:hypothetical protein H0H92_001137 [Tricholoma furcatifolium]
MSLEPELFDILRAYASLAPLKGIKFPEDLGFDAIHTFLVDHILLNPHFLQYPPSEQYQSTFWKWAIHRLEKTTNDEACDVEIDPRIYEHYLALLPSSGLVPGATRADYRDQLCPRGLPILKPPTPSYVTHYWAPYAQPLHNVGRVSLDDYETVTLLESRTTIESGTTGMRTWLASFVLSEFFIQHSELPRILIRYEDFVKKGRILELGSGIGFLAIILGRLQQFVPDEGSHRTLWLTDVNDSVLKRCRENFQMPCNMVSSANIECRFLDWSDALDTNRVTSLKTLLIEEIDADLIVGADIIFDPALIPALTRVLSLALQPGARGSPKTAIIAATIRNAATFEQFIRIAEREPLQVHELPTISGRTSFIQDVDTAIDNVKIFQITL